MQKTVRSLKQARNLDDPFEDHCWKEIIPADVIELYSSYRREVGVGPSPALVAIDLYELVYQGGAKPVPQGMNDERDLYGIRPEFKPRPEDVVITKVRASAFFGTPLAAHLTQLGVQSVIVCGESTSGCVRASAVDAYSHGFHVTLVEECCFDRSPLSHKVNLFDMHHKYRSEEHT